MHRGYRQSRGSDGLVGGYGNGDRQRRCIVVLDLGRSRQGELYHGVHVSGGLASRRHSHFGSARVLRNAGLAHAQRNVVDVFVPDGQNGPAHCQANRSRPFHPYSLVELSQIIAHGGDGEGPRSTGGFGGYGDGGEAGRRVVRVLGRRAGQRAYGYHCIRRPSIALEGRRHRHGRGVVILPKTRRVHAQRDVVPVIVS